MALKIKIKIHYIKDIISPVILILPSLASSPSIGSRSASLMPTRRLKVLRSILPPLFDSIHKIRSMGDCGMLIYIT